MPLWAAERARKGVRGREQDAGRPGRDRGLLLRLRERPRIRPRVYEYLAQEKESLRQGFAALFLSSLGELFAVLTLYYLRRNGMLQAPRTTTAQDAWSAMKRAVWPSGFLPGPSPGGLWASTEVPETGSDTR